MFRRRFVIFCQKFASFRSLPIHHWTIQFREKISAECHVSRLRRFVLICENLNFPLFFHEKLMNSPRGLLRARVSISR